MKNKRGGARTGAGRKGLGSNKKASFACRLPKEIKAIIYEQAEKLDMSAGEYVEHIIKQSIQ